MSKYSANRRGSSGWVADKPRSRRTADAVLSAQALNPRSKVGIAELARRLASGNEQQHPSQRVGRLRQRKAIDAEVRGNLKGGHPLRSLKPRSTVAVLLEAEKIARIDAEPSADLCKRPQVRDPAPLDAHQRGGADPYLLSGIT